LLYELSFHHGIESEMSIVQDSENLTGGRRVCEDCEEAAQELLWCENCRIALCFECDSHFHHAKSPQSSHQRVLLPSACTLSSLPLISAHTKHGTNVLSEASNPAKAWRNSSNGISADVRELHGSRGDAFDSLPPAFCLKEKRKRKKKRGKDDVALSCATETAANNFKLKKPQQEPGAGETLSSKPVSSLTGSTLNIRISRESKLLEHGEDSMHESDTSDLSFCGSSQIRSPTLSFARSPIPTLEPLKSALRGGHQGSGLGPRPKLHVNWHPDVYDPICSTVSHTLGSDQKTPVFLSRRNYQKHLRHKNKGQSNSQASGKKQGSNVKAKKPGGSPNARSVLN
jgi:hypothetical protein